MAGKRIKHPIFRGKLLYTLLFVVCYLLCRSLPLYGIDRSVHAGRELDAQLLLQQTISGDYYQNSLFALGISPYIIASMGVQVVMGCISSEQKKKISPKKVNRWVVAVMFVTASIQALLHLEELTFVESGYGRILAQVTAAAEMITGAFLILWLSGRNKRYGIGGQTLLIYVNLLDGLLMTLQKHKPGQLAAPLLFSYAAMLVVLVMENAEKRIPMLRISIHNIYADKNYLAIKLNPVGVMPAMFASALFMLPQMLVRGLKFLFPDSGTLLWWQANLVLTKPLGIGVYILALYFLTISFSLIFVSPGDLTEQLLKSGDSIANLHSGKETKRYLTREILRIAFLSATVLGICLGVPMLLQLTGRIESSLVMLPSSVMMLTGIWCSLRQEVITIRNYDNYQPFI